jgi:hypothetical protein
MIDHHSRYIGRDLVHRYRAEYRRQRRAEQRLALVILASAALWLVAAWLFVL